MLMMAFLAMLAACTGGDKFKVSGKVDGASDTTKLMLEVSSNGKWFVVDSAVVDGNGSFAFVEQAPEFPNIYRIRMGEQSIYFPIDSTDVLSITTKMKAFDTSYTLDGTLHAKEVMEIDKKAMSMSGNQANAEQMAAWKKQLAQQILKDPSGIVAYYVINKYIDDKPLFDPTIDFDFKVIGAVANAFNAYRKNDPRTQYLVEQTLEGQKLRRQQKGGVKQIEAQLINLIDIKLQDEQGKEHSLQAEASKGGVTLLNFTMYDQPFSPALNKLLNDLYTQYRAKGLSIYQVGLDQNLGQWRAAAGNLPWVTVYDPNGEMSQNVRAYNVNAIPVVFIINRQGEIVERVEDISLLQEHVERHL